MSMTALRRPDRLYLRSGVELEVVHPASRERRTCRCYAALYGCEIEVHYHQVAVRDRRDFNLFYGFGPHRFRNTGASLERIRQNVFEGPKLPEPGRPAFPKGFGGRVHARKGKT